MSLHLSSTGKTTLKTQLTRSLMGKSGVNKSTSVNRSSTTFGLGPSQWKITDENHSAFLLENLRIQRENREFTDITFTYDGESFCANRVVLAALSPVMRNVFTKREDLMNGEILPPDALQHTISFIYNASTEVKLDVIKKIEKVSRVLQMHPITNTCSNLLATIPEFADDNNDGGTTKRLRQIPRPKTQESLSSLDNTPLHHQSSADSNKSSSMDAVDGNGISAAEISDVLLGTKKGNRTSIRLTVNSESETTLSRSSDDVDQLSNPASPLQKDVQGDLDELTPDSKSPESLKEGQKKWEEKRKQFALHKSPPNHPIKELNSKAKSPPLLLSKLMQEANLRDNGTISRTWPKRGLNGTPKRQNLPQHWGPSTGHLMTSKPITRKVRNSNDVKKRSGKPRLTQDKYMISFKSRSIPNLLKGLNTLREQGLFCDMTIEVGGTRIPCHRAILAASSPVFRNILTQVKSRGIVLKKLEESAVLEIVKFIYTGQCSIDRDNVMTVMKGCLHFRIGFVAQKCVNYLDEYATSSQNFFSTVNVLLAFKLSGEYGFLRLREESGKFAVSRFWDLIDTKSFRDLPWADLNRLLSNDSLRSSKRDSEKELLLFQALVGWLNQAPQSRAPHTAAAMKYVSFTNIHPEALRQVAKGDIAMQNSNVRGRVFEAYKKQATAVRSHSLQLSQNPLSSWGRDPEEEVIHALVCENKNGKISNKLYKLISPKKSPLLVSSTPVSLVGCSVTSYRENVYVAGGRDGADSKKVCSEVFRFNATTGWTTLPSMTISRSHFSLIPLDGAICAIGGLSENQDKQYIVSTSCETLRVEPNDFDKKWEVRSWALPQPSYSHAAVHCSVSRDDGNNENSTSEHKNESKKKVSGSPSAKRGIRLSAPFIDVKSPILNRSSPKQRLGKNKKSQSQDPKSVNSSSLIFVCGGKINPRQNLLLQQGTSNFVEKAQLPSPCTRLSMAVYCSKVYVACDDVMETTEFRMFEYSVYFDQWTEMTIPVAIAKPLHSPNMDPHPKESEHPKSTSISCISTPTGVFLAVCVNDVICIEHLNLVSLKWSPFTRAKLQHPVSEFKLCHL